MTTPTNEPTDKWMPYPPSVTHDLQAGTAGTGRVPLPPMHRMPMADGAWAPWPDNPVARRAQFRELSQMARSA